MVGADCWEELKMTFETTPSLASFWIKVKAEYAEFTEIVLKTLRLFALTYLCETGFWNSVIKTKYRKNMDINSLLHVALSSIEPRLAALTEQKQAQFSH